MVNKISLLISCALLSSVAYAAELYRWVDENGRTHIEDTVPARYKNAATKIDTHQFELSESQRREAIARTAKEKQDLDARIRLDAEKAEIPAAKGAQAKPAPAPGSDAECEQLKTAYRESQECFAPYRQANGSVKAEAFQNCQTVADPSSQCGLRPAN
jgi:Domain of unknown function (DUF4124)